MSYRNVLTDYTSLETTQCKNMYLSVNKKMDIMNKSNANKYLTQIPTDERKYKLKNYEEQWNSTKDLIKSITNNLMIYF